MNVSSTNIKMNERHERAYAKVYARINRNRPNSIHTTDKAFRRWREMYRLQRKKAHKVHVRNCQAAKHWFLN